MQLVKGILMENVIRGKRSESIGDEIIGGKINLIRLMRARKYSELCQPFFCWEKIHPCTFLLSIFQALFKALLYTANFKGGSKFLQTSCKRQRYSKN